VLICVHLWPIYVFEVSLLVDFVSAGFDSVFVSVFVSEDLPFDGVLPFFP
jgi:hypothetical protein